MMKGNDLEHILRAWPYEPGHITVRRILGDDDRVKIQMRLDLGVLQMEVTGRPDGRRPHGRESLLHYHLTRLQEHRTAYGNDLGFELSTAICKGLRAEASMYYHRYLALFVLEDYEGVEQDTARNLRVLDLCRRYGENERDRCVLEQFRPYILMMQTRARAHLSAKKKLWKKAQAEVDEGMRRIYDCYVEDGRKEGFAGSPEARLLRKLRRQINRRLPLDPLLQLTHKLDRAVREERYEEAARLRDQIKAITQGSET